MPNFNYMKKFRYDELVDLIESIGYKHRTSNYYVIREHNGYINISYHMGFIRKQYYITIIFHKNYYHGMGYGKKEPNRTFNDFKTFLEFINKYHNDLFRKVKLERIKCGIKNSI